MMARVERVQEILRRWDPIGVRPGEGAPADEYDDYAHHIVSMVARGCSVEELGAHLGTLAAVTIGAGANRERDGRTAEDIIQAIREKAVDPTGTEEPATPTPPPRAARPVRPRIWPALLVGAAILPLGWLTAVVLGLLFVGYRVAFGEIPPGSLLDLESPESLLFFEWLGSTSLIVLLVWLARRSRQNPWDRFALGPSRLSIWLQPAIVLGVFAADIIGAHLTTLLGVGPSESLAEAAGLMRDVGRDWLPAAVLMIAVVPALTEELLFRGYIQSRLLLRLPAGSAILLSSVLFAVAHGEPAYAIAVLPSGLWLGYVAYLSGSVWPGMICHFLGNAVWVLASMFGPDEAQEGAAEVQAAAGARMGVGEILVDILPLLLLLAVLSWILRKRRRRQSLVIAVRPFGGR